MHTHSITHFSVYMTEQELHPIPEGSVVTEAMVERWMAIYEGETRPTTIGTLLNFAEGRGELPAHVFDAVEHRDVFSSLRDVYFRQKGVNPPPFSNVEGADVNEDEGSAEENTEKTEELKADEANTEEKPVENTGEGSAEADSEECEDEKTEGSADESDASSADQAEA